MTKDNTFNRIHEHKKKVNGKTVTVKEQIRNDPKTRTGKNTEENQ